MLTSHPHEQRSSRISSIRGGNNPLLLGSSELTNRAPNHEIRRGVPMRTLHQRGVDERQAPNPGEERNTESRFLEDFLKFLCRPLGSIRPLQDDPVTLEGWGRVAGVHGAVQYSRSGHPDMDVRRSRFELLDHLAGRWCRRRTVGRLKNV